MSDPLLAVLVGLVQGVLEWLPVSSEAGVAIALTAATGADPGVATRFALFLHGGTALAATAYYRDALVALAADVRQWGPRAAFDRDTAELSFLTLATLASGLTGGLGYLVLETVVTELTGGAFVALIGVLLVATGVTQRVAGAGDASDEVRSDGGVRATDATALDAVLVGLFQGLAILPGISRSGTTISVLLLRGYDGPRSLRLSFLLSIPATAVAGVLIVVDGGVPSVAPGTAILALAVSAVVGYLTVDALVRLVERVAFWGVCVGFGVLAILGGALLLVV